jgi:transcriptional regulator with XRE-family HTH domain
MAIWAVSIFAQGFMKLSKKLQIWRSLRGQSVREAAAAVGVNWSTYHHWERGYAKPSAKYQAKVAAALDITADELLKLLAQ